MNLKKVEAKDISTTSLQSHERDRMIFMSQSSIDFLGVAAQSLEAFGSNPHSSIFKEIIALLEEYFKSSNDFIRILSLKSLLYQV